MLALADVEAVLDDAPVGEGHALRDGRGAGRVEDVAEVRWQYRALRRGQRRRGHLRRASQEIVEPVDAIVPARVDAQDRAQLRQPLAAELARLRP